MWLTCGTYLISRLPYGQHGPRYGRPDGRNDGRRRLPARHEFESQNGRGPDGRTYGPHGARRVHDGAPYGGPRQDAALQRSERASESERAKHDPVPTDEAPNALQLRPERSALPGLPPEGHTPDADGGRQRRGAVLPPRRERDGDGAGHARGDACAGGHAADAALPRRVQLAAQDGRLRPRRARPQPDVRARLPRRQGRHGARQRPHGGGAAPTALHGRRARVQGAGVRGPLDGGPQLRGAVPQLPAAAVRDGQPRAAAALPPLSAVQVMTTPRDRCKRDRYSSRVSSRSPEVSARC